MILNLIFFLTKQGSGFQIIMTMKIMALQTTRRTELFF